MIYFVSRSDLDEFGFGFWVVALIRMPEKQEFFTHKIVVYKYRTSRQYSR